MKQRITFQQLNELSYKDKEKLREWWKPAIGDWWFYDHEIQLLEHNTAHFLEGTKEGAYPAVESHIVTGGNVITQHIQKTKPAYPLLTIGQMLQFLYEHKQPMNALRPWEVVKGYGGSNDSFCDMLWDTVKKFLDEMDK